MHETTFNILKEKNEAVEEKKSVERNGSVSDFLHTFSTLGSSDARDDAAAVGRANQLHERLVQGLQGRLVDWHDTTTQHDTWIDASSTFTKIYWALLYTLQNF